MNTALEPCLGSREEHVGLTFGPETGPGLKGKGDLCRRMGSGGDTCWALLAPAGYTWQHPARCLQARHSALVVSKGPSARPPESPLGGLLPQPRPQGQQDLEAGAAPQCPLEATSGTTDHHSLGRPFRGGRSGRAPHPLWVGFGALSTAPRGHHCRPRRADLALRPVFPGDRGPEQRLGCELRSSSLTCRCGLVFA